MVISKDRTGKPFLILFSITPDTSVNSLRPIGLYLDLSRVYASMMTSSNENIFRVTGLCAGNSPVTGEFPSQRPVTRSFDVFLGWRLNKWFSNRDVVDLRRHGVHYDVIVMSKMAITDPGNGLLPYSRQGIAPTNAGLYSLKLLKPIWSKF